MINIMKRIKDFEKYEDNYYPYKEKIIRKKPRKKDLDSIKKSRMFKLNKK